MMSRAYGFVKTFDSVYVVVVDVVVVVLPLSSSLVATFCCVAFCSAAKRKASGLRDHFVAMLGIL